MAICNRAGARFVVEPQPRYRELQADRWPVTVAPQDDELLSSWLHRLALANGVAPRHLSDVLGLGAGMWSARRDGALADGTLEVLHRQTGVARARIAMMTLGAGPGIRLLLPLRHVASRKAATWLQFCPPALRGMRRRIFDGGGAERPASRASSMAAACAIGARTAATASRPSPSAI